MTSRTRIVFLKELRETFRDRRVILSVIVSPLLVTPLLLLAVGGMASQKDRASRAEVLRAGVVGAAALPGLSSALAADATLSVVEVPTREEAEAAVREQRLRAVLVVPPGAGSELAEGRAATLELVVDTSNEKSHTARERLRSAINKLRDVELERRLRAHGLERAALSPLELKADDVASEKKKGGSILGFLLPYVVILSASFGGMTSAFDLCAGEKERGTMETLLVSPASRREIILGKLATIGVVSIVAAVCSVSGLVGVIVQGAQLGRSLGGETFAVSYTSVLAMVVMIVPMVLMTSSLMLLISTFARNQKEAQAYAFPMMIFVLLPALFSFILGPENSLGLGLVPILNTALAMKQVLSGIFNFGFLGLALGSSAIYAALAMRLVVSMFERESILFRA